MWSCLRCTSGPDAISRRFKPSILALRYDCVRYRNIADADSVANDEIPFTKRNPYRFECEFRIILESPDNPPLCEIDFNPTSIQRITCSAWMSAAEFESERQAIAGYFNGNVPVINHSTILENPQWIAAFRNRPGIS